MKLTDAEYLHAEATDLPVKKLVALAKKVADQKIKEGFNVDIHFKHTCHNCRSRMMFELPNTIYEEVECGNCGHKEPFIKGGFSMIYKFNDPEVNDARNVATDPHGKSGGTAEVSNRRAADKGGKVAGIIPAADLEPRN